MQTITSSDLLVFIAVLAGLLFCSLILGLRHFITNNRELKAELASQVLDELGLRDGLHASEKTAERLQLELRNERTRLQDRELQFEQSRKQLKIEFENLANKVLEDKSRSFDKTNQQSIEGLLKPFREQVEGFQKRVNEVHKDSIEGHSRLGGEIKRVLEVGLKMGAEAKNLTDALKGDSQKRGSWGETQLEKTLQMSGLVERDHYQKQTSMQDSDGRRKQTDFLINLPDNKHLVIDSKVSLAAYDRAVGAENDEQLERALIEHVRAVKRHIDDLSSKDYSNLIGVRSPSFVLMFMPIEPAYIEAMKYEKDLFSYGYDKNIVLVSHTTLIPILRTVANLWSLERSSQEARKLGDKAGDIYNQVCKVATHLNKVGGSLQAATNHFNSTARALTGRQGLHGKVERFAEVSAKVTQSMVEIEPLHHDVERENLELLAVPIEEELIAKSVEEA